MRQTTITFSRIIFICLLGLILIACQREDPVVFNQDIDPVKHEVESTDTQYLLDLIATIEGLVADGTLNAGNGNALISKIENAIKSIDKGNTNAVSGQLSSFINSTEALVNSGTLTDELGETLIAPAEEGIMMADGIFIDPRDGEEYTIVKIGEQIWMAENLRTTKLTNGTPIPLVEDNSEWENLTTPAYCWYNNDEETFKYPHGALYNWYTVETGNLCPVGWHVPSAGEFGILASYAGGYSYAGYKLRDTGTIEEGTGYWYYAPRTIEATNEYGFTALGSGYRGASFSSIGRQTRFWTSYSFWRYGDCWILFNDMTWFYATEDYMYLGFSIRCLKD